MTGSAHTGYLLAADTLAHVGGFALGLLAYLHLPQGWRRGWRVALFACSGGVGITVLVILVVALLMNALE